MPPPPAGSKPLNVPVIAPVAHAAKSANHTAAKSGNPPPGSKPVAITGTVLPGMNVAASEQSLAFPGVDMRDVKISHAEDSGLMRTDQADWLKQNKAVLSPQEFQHSYEVFTNTNPHASIYTAGQYYFDKEGLPQPIKFGERPPEYAHLQSAWGSQQQAEDDSVFTTLGKAAYNSFIDIIKLPATVIDLGYNLFGGEDSTEISNHLRNVVDAGRFNISQKAAQPIGSKPSGDPFTSMSDVYNWDNYHFNSQNISNAIGNAIGMIGQMYVLGAGGKGASAAEVLSAEGLASQGINIASRELSIAQRVAPFAKATGANTMFMLNSAYDAAAEQGLKGRERFAVAMTSAIGQGVIMSMMFPQKPFNPLTNTAQKEISESVVKKFAQSAGGKITPESIKAAYIESVAKSISVLKTKPFLLANAGVKTGGAMVASRAWENAVLTADAKIKGDTYEKGVFTPQAMEEYINSFFSGAIMGVVGGIAHGTPESRDADQSKTVYAYVKEGREKELIHNIDLLVSNKQLSVADGDSAKLRIAAYKRFNQETKDVKLTDENRQEIFGLTWKSEGVKKQISELEADESLTPAIKEAKLKNLHDEDRVYVNKIADLMGRKVNEEKVEQQQKAAEEQAAKQAEDEAIKLAEEVAKETVNEPVVPEAEINKVAQKIASGETKFSSEELQIQSNYPEGIETVLNQMREEGAPIQVQAVELFGKKQKIKQKRKRLVKETIEKRPELEGYEHHDNDGGETPRLVGGQSADLVSRDSLKVGDILDVRESLSTKSGYHRFLNAYIEGTDKQVGSPEYKSRSNPRELSYHDQLIEKLIKEGNDVKLVVTSSKMVHPYKELRDPDTGRVMQVKNADKSVRYVEYQVVSRPKGYEAKAKVEPAKTVVEKPISKAAIEKQRKAEREEKLKQIFKKEPVSFEEDVLRYFISGNKIDSESLVRNVGKKIANKEMFMFRKTGGAKTDKLDEYFDLERHGIRDQQMAERDFFDIVTKHKSIQSMVARLIEINSEQSGKSEYEVMMDMVPDDAADQMQAEISEAVDEHVDQNPVPEELQHFLNFIGIDLNKIVSIDDMIELVNMHSDKFDGFPFTAHEKTNILNSLENAKAEPNFQNIVRGQMEEFSRFLPEAEGGEGYTGENEAGDPFGETLKYQDKSSEPLSSTDPELHEAITSHLKKLFPKIELFSDADKFQSFLDRNFLGSKLDMEKIGAAIGNAIYINPNRAVQSTAIHEYSHIYWDALPKNDPVKVALSKMFPSEEAAISAIGKIGTKAAEIKLKGSVLTKFLQHVREFWSKVKNTFGVANEKDLTRIFASRLWKNADRIELIAEGGDGPMKYMEETATTQQRFVAGNLQTLAGRFDFDPKEHTYTLKDEGVQYRPVNEIIQGDRKYAYKGKQAKEYVAKTGTQIHEVAQGLIRGEDFASALKKSGLKISEAAKEPLRKGLNEVIEKLRSKGMIMPETIFANSYFKTAGQPDIPIIAKDGTVNIFDFKTSTQTTTEGSFYERQPGGGKASKADRQRVQIAMYGLLAEHGDISLGLEPHKIGNTGIVPIRLKFKGEEVVDAVVEPVIEFPYYKYRDEARRLLSKNREAQKKVDSDEIKYSGTKTRDEYLKVKNIDEAALEAELDGLEENSSRAKEIVNILDQAEQSYLRYKEDYQQAKQIQNTDISKMSKEELLTAYESLVGYDNLTHNIAIKDILVAIGDRMRDIRTDELEAAGKQAGPEKDISALDVYLMAPSDVKESLPALQEGVKRYRDVKQAEEQEMADIIRQTDDLVRALIKDKEKDSGKLNKVLKSFRKGVPPEYFDNLFLKKADVDGPAMFKDSADPSLSAAEKTFLKYVQERQGEYLSKQATSERGYWDGFYAEISPNFWETYHNHGLLKAIDSRFRDEQPEELGDMEVEFNNPVTGKKEYGTYNEVEKILNDYGSQGPLKKADATRRLMTVQVRAKKALDAYTAKMARTEGALPVKGTASRYTLNKNGEMVSKFHWQRSAEREVSYDVHRAFLSYMTDMVHIKHIQPILPELIAVKEYYRERGVNPNTEEFIRHWIDGDIFGKEFVGKLGRGVDETAKFLQAWTYLNIMTFNPKIGFFNWSTGKINQFRATGILNTGKGEARYWKNPSKKQAILQHYGVLDAQLRGGRKYNSRNMWKLSANGFVSLGENSIRGAAFFSHLTEAEYAAIERNFDSSGKIIDPKNDIDRLRITQIKKQIEDIQGKYEFMDKRMYKHYGLMSAVMGFKGWMPDWIRERFGGEYTDLYNVTHKGSYRSLPYIFRDMKEMLLNFQKFRDSDDVNTINNKKNIRALLTFASLMGAYAVASDDPREKRKGQILLTMAGDAAGLLNLSKTSFGIAKPLPFMGTVANFVDAFANLTTHYMRDGKYGKKGDWEFPGKIINVMPYNHSVKGAYQEIANPDYKGQ